jgi:hypothetical protein
LKAAPSSHTTAAMVVVTRPTGPNVVALFSHLDQCGTVPPVWIGASTNPSAAHVGGRGVSSLDGA